jgi:hypothetical protein
VAHGLSSRSSKSNLVAFSSSFEALPGAFSGFERSALVELLAVTLERRAIDPEAAGGLGLLYALLHRLDDLLPEVERISTHASTIPGAPSSQSAVRTHCDPG